MTPSVVALHQSPRRGERDALERATLTAGAGLDGDRHAKPGSRRALLLMEHETLDRLGLAPGRVSEQITVRGVDLHGLAHGTRLQIGETTLELTYLAQLGTWVTIQPDAQYVVHPGGTPSTRNALW